MKTLEIVKVLRRKKGIVIDGEWESIPVSRYRIPGNNPETQKRNLLQRWWMFGYAQCLRDVEEMAKK